MRGTLLQSGGHRLVDSLREFGYVATQSRLTP
jgi:hypothetical protein